MPGTRKFLEPLATFLIVAISSSNWNCTPLKKAPRRGGQPSSLSAVEWNPRGPEGALGRELKHRGLTAMDGKGLPTWWRRVQYVRTCVVRLERLWVGVGGGGINLRT